MATIKSIADQLEEVQTAITTIMTKGQAYGIGGRTLTRADMAWLERREERLRRLYEREQHSASTSGVYGRTLIQMRDPL